MAFVPFREVLEAHLRARRLSLRGFARMAGVSVSLLSRLKTGERSVPLARVEAMADHLGLAGRARATFIDSAMWTTVPRRLRPWLETKLAPRRRRPEAS